MRNCAIKRDKTVTLKIQLIRTSLEQFKTLISLSYFATADITNPKSSPLELPATVPDYQIPFVPIIQEGEQPFAMMLDLQKKYNWVLDTISYDSLDTLVEILKPHIIDPAIKKHDELRKIKVNVPTVISGGFTAQKVSWVDEFGAGVSFGEGHLNPLSG